METAYEPSWDDLRVLLAVHRHRSFLAAGRALGISTSTTSRRIEALEQALDRPLVHRSSAGTSLEPEALELVNLAEQLELASDGYPHIPLTATVATIVTHSRPLPVEDLRVALTRLPADATGAADAGRTVAGERIAVIAPTATANFRTGPVSR